MTFNELKLGMAVVFRNGEKRILVGRDQFLNVDYDIFEEDSDYLNDLKSTVSEDYDIVAVYENGTILNGEIIVRNLLWELVEIDYSTLEEYTKIQVKNSGNKWYNAYFAGIGPTGEYLAWYKDDRFINETGVPLAYNHIRLYEGDK